MQAIGCLVGVNYRHGPRAMNSIRCIVGMNDRYGSRAVNFSGKAEGSIFNIVMVYTLMVFARQ